MFSYSKSIGRIVPTFFTFVILIFSALSGHAQDKASQRGAAPEIFGTRYDGGGHVNSIKNLQAKQPANNLRVSAPTLGEVDPAFSPSMDLAYGTGRASVVQPDGKMLIAGYFRTIGGVPHNSIVRLNPDYSIDTSFAANVNGTVNAIALQSDGRIIIGGAFTAVDGTGANYIARLSSNGAIDTTFDTGGGASDVVYDVAVQPDGKILLGGSFIGVGANSRPYIARLTASGAVDSSFNSFLPTPATPTSVPSIVYSIALQSDGKIVLGGFVTKTYLPTPVVSPIVRLDSSGAIDPSFNPGTINSNSYKVAVQPDGKILMCGFFSSVGGVSRNRIARFNTDGSLDTSFDPGTGSDGPLFTFNLRADGSILIGGVFTLFNGTSRHHAALLKGDGSLDPAFNLAFTLAGSVYTVSTGADGRVLLGGSAVSPFENRDTFAVADAAGNLATGINLNTSALGGTRAVAVQPDGKIIVGGNFNRVNGVAHPRIVRLNPDGTVDTSFNTGGWSISTLNTLLLQPDGKILVAGGGLTTGSIGQIVTLARINADGSWDSTFSLGNLPARLGKALALQPDGKILFSYSMALLGNPFAGSISRINTDGSVDASFDGLDLPFEAIAVEPDGHILAAGPTGIGYVNSGTGQSEIHNGIVRLNSDGSHDRTFRSGFVSNEGGAGFTAVYAIERQSDGRILVGGTLYTGTSTSPVGIARLNSTGTIDGTFQLNQVSSAYEFPRVRDIKTLPNGKIVVGGLFSNFGGWSQNNIARVDQSGNFDQSFAASTDGTVYDVASDASGRVLIGGDFEKVNNTARTGIARLLSETVTRRAAYDFDGDGKSDISVFRPSEGNWYLQRSQAGFTGIHFGLPTDKLVPADYDADGKTDVAVYRDGAWYIMGSQAGFLAYTFGQAGDIPQPADFNGDGKAELCVFRPSNGDWYKLDLNGNVFTGVHFGQTGDKPVVGDYDGDGKADPAVFRDGDWYMLGSTVGFYGQHWGIATDEVVPADYDGDGKTDQAVVRDGFWYLLGSTAGYTSVAWGLPTDVPVAADYDGDGKANPSVYRDGQWYILQPGGDYTVAYFGLSTDKPVPASFLQ